MLTALILTIRSMSAYETWGWEFRIIFACSGVVFYCEVGCEHGIGEGVRADLEMEEQFDEIFIWEVCHPGREGCGWREEVQPDHRDFCVLPSSSWPIDMLVEGKSVSTEISGPSESRKLSTPVFLVFYISPPVRLAFPPNASAVTPICPS